MTKETNLKKLREIIIKANSEIRVGDYVKYYEKGDSEFKGITMVLSINKKKNAVEWKFGWLDLKFCKIIDRNIGLADVLITLAKNNIVSESGIFVDVMGRFWKIKPCGGKNEMRIMCRWELFRASDNLNNQSSETIKWLLGILDN